MGNSSDSGNSRLLEDYIYVKNIICVLGSGTVMKHSKTRQMIFVEQLIKNDQSDLQVVEQRLQLQKTLKHKNVLQMLGFEKIEHRTLTCTTTSKLHVVMEFFDSTLTQKIEYHKMHQSPMNELEIQTLIEHVIDGMCALQNKKFPLLSITADSIFIDDSGTHKVAIPTVRPNLQMSMRGTPIYYSPQQLDVLTQPQLQDLKQQKVGLTTFKSLVFQFGMVIIEAMSLQSQAICYDYNKYSLDSNLIEQQLHDLMNHFPQQIIELVALMLRLQIRDQLEPNELREEYKRLFSQSPPQFSSQHDNSRSIVVEQHDIYKEEVQENNNYDDPDQINYEGIPTDSYQPQSGVDQSSMPLFNTMQPIINKKPVQIPVKQQPQVVPVRQAPVRTIQNPIEYPKEPSKVILPIQSLNYQATQEIDTFRTVDPQQQKPVMKLDLVHYKEWREQAVKDFNDLKRFISTSDQLMPLPSYSSKDYVSQYQSEFNFPLPTRPKLQFKEPPTIPQYYPPPNVEPPRIQSFRSSDDFVFGQQTAPVAMDIEQYYAKYKINEKVEPPKAPLKNQPITFESFSISSPQPLEATYVKNKLYDDGSYTGYVKQNQRHGFGSMKFREETSYEGEWVNDKMQGKGTLYHSNGRAAYIGDWQQNQFHGQGTLYNNAPDMDIVTDYNNLDNMERGWIKYEGQFEKDTMNGQGTLHFVNNDKFVGVFKEDCADGSGKYILSTGREISGTWRQNRLSNY